MNSFIIFSLLVLQLFSPSLSFNCPVDNNFRPIDGAYRDPRFCGAYFQCIDGKAYPQNCPLGLFFRFSTLDCKIITCVDPELSDCPIEEIRKYRKEKAVECEPGQKDFTTPCYTKNDECSPFLNETVPSLIDCRIYYHCDNGVSWPQQCPPGYFFNPIVNPRDCTVKLCVPPEDANCPRPGGWSAWSPWGACEPSCGQEGIRTRTRDCNNPPPANGGAECPGLPIEVENCQTPPCPIAEEPAFMVSLQRSAAFNAQRIRWTSIDVNQHNLYNSRNNELNITKPGLYFFSMTATIGSNVGVHLSLDNTGRSTGLKRDRNVNSFDLITRGSLFNLNTLFRPNVYQRLGYTYLTGDDIGKDTSWLGFKYTTNNYLFAASEAAVVENGFIRLNSVISLRGFSITNFNRRFVASEPGIYFVNFGVGVSAGESVNASIFISSTNEPGENIVRHSYQVTGNDQLSRSFIRQTNGSSFEYRMDGSHNSTDGLATYLLAFKLNESSPILFVSQVPGVNSPCLSSFTRMEFNRRTVDTTNSWSFQNNSYIAPVNGTYYVDLSIVVFRRSTVAVYVQVNNVEKFRLLRRRGDHSNSELISKAGLVEMFEGDHLTVVYQGCIGTDNMSSSMSLFLL